MSKRYANQWQLYTGSPTIETARSRDRPESPVYEVPELHDLVRADPPETDDERLQRVERCMLALTEEWMMLTGQAEPPVPVPERERMRRVIEAMRPIVDAAMLYIDELYGDAGWDNLDQLRMFVAAGRSRLAAAMSAWEGGARDEPNQAIDERDIEWHAWPLRTTGGQQVTPQPGIMGLHRPTGIAAASEGEPSQMRNKAVVVDILRTLVANARRTP